MEGNCVAAEKKFKLSVLDVSPVATGSTSTEALRNTLDLAQLADQLGFTRYWLAEHHNTPLIASSAPEIMIGHVASVTNRIRVGSGGIMLPNHSPLKVAETFRVLEALHPGRVDLGLGRAPGTDSLTALGAAPFARTLGADDFPGPAGRPARVSGPRLSARATRSSASAPCRTTYRCPRSGCWVPAIFPPNFRRDWACASLSRTISSPFPLSPRCACTDEHFQPSEYRKEPEALIGVSVVCAETDERAEEMARPLQLTLLRFRSGKMGRFPSIGEATDYPYTADEREIMEMNRDRNIVGSPKSVRARLTRLAEAAAVDEIMVTTMTHEHADRRRSYELLADAFNLS